MPERYRATISGDLGSLKHSSLNGDALRAAAAGAHETAPLVIHRATTFDSRPEAFWRRAVCDSSGMALRVLVVQNDWDKSLGRIAAALLAESLDLDVHMSCEDLPDAAAYDGLVTLPGLADPDDDDPPIQRVRRVTERALEEGLPVLGICLGGQLLAQVLGGETYRSRKELGFHEVRATNAAADDPLLGEVPGRFPAFHAHAYAFRPPAGAVTLLENDVCVQACRLGDAWAFQCHPEATLEWIGALSRGIRGTVEGIDPSTVEFFRSNGVEPDVLESDSRDAAIAADAVARSIGSGFGARVHDARRSLGGRM